MAKELLCENWWLMHCDLPTLNWARLRVYSDGSAEVQDCDDRTLWFRSEAEAEIELEEDEFVRLDPLDKEDELEYGIAFSRLVPPASAKREKPL